MDSKKNKLTFNLRYSEPVLSEQVQKVVDWLNENGMNNPHVEIQIKFSDGTILE